MLRYIVFASSCKTQTNVPRSVKNSGIALWLQQCAMVVACVKDRLPAHEAAAIHARFGYQIDKAAGVRGVVGYAGALLSVGHADARLAMGWAVFGTDVQRKEITAAAIAREWAIPAKTVERDVATIKRTARRLQEAAVDALAEMFRRDGVC